MEAVRLVSIHQVRFVGGPLRGSLDFVGLLDIEVCLQMVCRLLATAPIIP